MKTIYSSLRIKTVLHFALMVAMLSAFTLNGFAQNTTAGTPIKNTASATYGDGSGPPTQYSTVSNEVVVTVAKVAGLTITPDGSTAASVVAGQTGVIMDFVVTNTGNFNDQVRFLANGGSFQIPAGATATSAVILGPNTNILTNGAAVLHSVNKGANFTVRLTLSISASATAGSNIQVFLGDQTTLSPTFDNAAANSSANEVRTEDATAVNGRREARGDITLPVQNDAQIRANLTAPAGPVALGSNITYTASACNDGARPLSVVDPDGAGPIPARVYVVAPIPVGTQLTGAVSSAAGTVYYSTNTPLSAATPNSLTGVTWTSTLPTLSTVTRLLIPVSSSAIAAGGACSANVTFDVTITTNNANTPIYEIIDAFGNNSIAATITDQSGDNTPSKGDGNASFDEPLFGGTVSPTQGFQLPTTLTKSYGVLNGPNGAANANGPSSNNDDFTNKSASIGIAGVAPGGVTTAASGAIVFTNSLQNTGNANDTFRLTYVPGSSNLPAGSTVEIFNGTAWINVTNGTSFVDVAVPFGTALVNYQARISLPTGQTVLTGYGALIRATSQNDTSKTNDTIDRVYTGFVRLVKTATVTNGTGVGGATDAVPGAVINYSIVYTNISSAGSAGNGVLIVNNLVITENGNVAPNDWGATTDQVVGSGADSATGTVAGDTVGSTLLTDTIPLLAPGLSGTFSFKRTIK